MDDPKEIVKAYRVFSAQIELIASMINAKDKRCREMILWDSFTLEILQVISHSHPRTDPLLLHSVCHLAHMVLLDE